MQGVKQSTSRICPVVIENMHLTHISISKNKFNRLTLLLCLILDVMNQVEHTVMLYCSKDAIFVFILTVNVLQKYKFGNTAKHFCADVCTAYQVKYYQQPASKKTKLSLDHD